MTPRFLGLDLAWSERNPSGLAALDGAGRVVDLRADLRGDDAILAWVRAQLGDRGALGIDMPTIVRNAAGSRPCERDARAALARFDAGVYPANLGLAPFAGGGRARRLLDALRADGVAEAIDLAPREPRTVAFEVHPHGAAVRLFGLPRILKYKKKNRPWPAVLAEWARYRTLVAGLAAADPPLALGDALPKRVGARGYKAHEDALDAVLCAYVAAFVWRHGTRGGLVEVFGDLESGHIVVPAAPPPRLSRAPSG